MKVFNLYGKIIKRNIISVVAYIVAFIVITLLFVGNQGSSSPNFQNQQIPITLVNHDESVLIDGLIEYLNQYVIYRDVEDNDLLDALYYREIYAVITIPHGFTTDWQQEGNIQITREAIPDAEYILINVESAINRYLNMATMYQTNLPDWTLDDIVNQITIDLTQEAIANRTIVTDNVLENATYYFNYLSYVLFAIILSIVGIVSLRLKKLDIKRRMLLSPYSQRRTNLEVMLGHGILAIGLVIIMGFLSILFYPSIAFSRQWILFIANCLCLSFAILSISYTIGLLVKGESALPAIANVVSLGTSFLTGVFVPQFLLGDGVLAIAHGLPNYYFVSNNLRISQLQSITWETTKSIILYMGIQLLFGCVFMVMALFISRAKNREEA
ncbi:MAG: ABC transporter permease [Bacilli bacterium]